MSLFTQSFLEENIYFYIYCEIPKNKQEKNKCVYYYLINILL